MIYNNAPVQSTITYPNPRLGKLREKFRYQEGKFGCHFSRRRALPILGQSELLTIRPIPSIRVSFQYAISTSLSKIVYPELNALNVYDDILQKGRIELLSHKTVGKKHNF